ncbi:MAG: Tim44 domain-containing protein [Beijerinckiaceae bacterium]|nr:Tim44 domain-containing protein [Beijerinckiaceae bacterium]
MNSRFISTKSMAAMAVALTVALAPALAEARPGGGSSAGSRGSRTYSAPPSTNTAPGAAAPMQRSMTPQGQPAPTQATRPGQQAAGAAQQQGGFFGSTLGRGLMAGLLGAGIFGLLSGSGLFSGLGSMSSIIGLIIQAGILYLIFRLVMGFIRSRRQPAMAGAAPDANSSRSSFGGMGGGLGGGLGAGLGGFGGGANQNQAPVGPTGPVVSDLTIEEADFSAFERKLAEIQSAYGEEDLAHLRRIVTPEMASYFAEGIAENARHGHLNKVSGAKLLQGDLSEAWREDNEDYATVAMRFSVMDTVVDRATGAYVSGDRDAPSEVTEIWTFTRPSGGTTDDWKLAAIQQPE